MSDIGERLAERTLELVEVPSVSGAEAAIVERVRMLMAPTDDAYELVDGEDTCLVYLPRTLREEMVVFAGHLDTVPVADAPAPSRAGDEIIGRGAADQKSGVAVMIELAKALASGDLASDLDVGFLFFGREEVEASALAPCLNRTPGIAGASLAIVTEPTGNALEVGCLGNLNARVIVNGKAAHSARPWLGDNAVHHGITALASIADLPVRDVEIDGLVYREVINVTQIEGGVAANVIPDRFTATVNFRYAPNHTPDEAEARLRELLGYQRAEVEVLGNAGPGPVVLGNPLVARLRDAGNLETRPKQAWTPVAEFAQAGVDAVNCGPGDPRYAHRDDERVAVDALVASYELFTTFLSSEARAG